MKQLPLLLFVIFHFLSLASAAQPVAQMDETNPLLVTTKSMPYEWSPGQGGQLELQLELPTGYHAYAETTKIRILEPDGFQVNQPQIEPLIEWYDKFSKRNRKGFQAKATLITHIEAPSRFPISYQKMKIELTYQACSEQFCLFPTTKIIDIPIRLTHVLNNSAEGDLKNMPTDAKPDEGLLSAQQFRKYLSGSLALGLLFVFIAGIFTSFTPCIFPMIPITLAVLGNHSEERTRLQNFIISVFYVLGIATTYSSLGVLAASSGGLFGASLGNPYILTAMCAVFLTMALSMYGLFELQVPAFIRNKFGAGKSKKGFLGAYVTGLLAGVVASPCVGPVLVAILSFVATSQNHWLGFIYLFTYALGLGMIFLALGAFTELSRFLPRSGGWMNIFKFILGTLMLTAFYYYLDLLVPVRWFDVSLGIGLVCIASVYGAFLASANKTPSQHLRKGLMQAVLFIGFAYLTIGTFDLRPYFQQRISGTASINQIKKLNWQPYSDEALKEAIAQQRPVIIDFWAEWCAACHELEEHTFSHPRIQALAENFVTLKFDATSDSPILRELKKRYHIQGLPTVVFINPQGVWLQALTLTEFENAEKFLKRMEKASN